MTVEQLMGRLRGLDESEEVRLSIDDSLYGVADVSMGEDAIVIEAGDPIEEE